MAVTTFAQPQPFDLGEHVRRLIYGNNTPPPTAAPMSQQPAPQIGAQGGFDFNALVNNDASKGAGQLLGAKAKQVEGEAGARHITNVSPDVENPFQSGFFKPAGTNPAQPMGYGGGVADVRNQQVADRAMTSPEAGNQIAARFGAGEPQVTPQSPAINPAQLTAIGGAPPVQAKPPMVEQQPTGFNPNNEQIGPTPTNQVNTVGGIGADVKNALAQLFQRMATTNSHW